MKDDQIIFIRDPGQAMTIAHLVAWIGDEIDKDPHLKSEHTHRAYKADLARFEAWRGGRPVTRLLVEEYAAHLQQVGRTPTTINRALAAIRWYARRLADHLAEQPVINDQEKFVRSEAVSQAERVASVKDVESNRRPTGRHIPEGELSALMAACENDLAPKGRRDAAMIALAWACGLRRDELAGLVPGDLVITGDDSADLTIRGKGDKYRTAYLYNGAFLALMDWLKTRGDLPGPLFCAINKGNNIDPAAGLTGNSMRVILDKRIAEAKIAPLTWHDFRRSFAGNLLDLGADLVTVQKLMGHSSPETTSGYDRRGAEVQRKAVRGLFVPYRKRLV